MRYVKKLADVKLATYDGTPIMLSETDNEQATSSILDFMVTRLRDPKFGASADTVMSANRIAQSIRDTRETDLPYVAIEELDWNVLVEVTKKPTQGMEYRPEVAANLASFMDAIINASSTRPTPPAEA